MCQEWRSKMLTCKSNGWRANVNGFRDHLARARVWVGYFKHPQGKLQGRSLYKGGESISHVKQFWGNTIPFLDHPPQKISQHTVTYTNHPSQPGLTSLGRTQRFTSYKQGMYGWLQPKQASDKDAFIKDKATE